MRSVPCLIDALGGSSKVTELLGLRAPTTVASWKSRQSIPPDYWPRIIDAARQCGLEGVTSDKLLELHTGERVLS